MRYLLGHTRLGFCWWDLAALLVLAVVIVVFVVRVERLKNEQRDLEERVSEMYHDDPNAPETGAGA